MNQQEMIIKYMTDFGSITPMEAFWHLGVTRLRAVIYDLKREGYVFDEKRETVVNRYGKKVSFKRFWIKENKDEQSNTGR